MTGRRQEPYYNVAATEVSYNMPLPRIPADGFKKEPEATRKKPIITKRFKKNKHFCRRGFTSGNVTCVI